MPTRNASARWEGGLRGGKGSFKSESGVIGGAYSFGSRFEAAGGTNPEELLAAANSACFSMAFAGALEKAGITAQSVETEAACTVEKVGDGFTITTMQLKTRVTAPGADAAKVKEIGEAAKNGCPVSRALGGVKISLETELA